MSFHSSLLYLLFCDSGNWFFQTEGSLLYKPLRLNCAPSDASYLGNVNEYLESNRSKNSEEKDIQVSRTIQIKSLTEEIKHMLNSMENGRSSVLAYDTAWVSFIPNTTNCTHLTRWLL
ncbi:copal-8-ol diphosphate hydratase, chloroplastic-like [Nicotiana sylvestris]|uniref:copal-8-ol diphosphate hydratase, chloroplastic-like n=1 Tax=Nicotiana sylvestris TaxID=4096 RepID=UPI00388CA52F